MRWSSELRDRITIGAPVVVEMRDWLNLRWGTVAGVTPDGLLLLWQTRSWYRGSNLGPFDRDDPTRPPRLVPWDDIRCVKLTGPEPSVLFGRPFKAAV